MTNVQKFMTKYGTPELVKAYTKSALLYYGEIPFLYCVFNLTDVPSLKEKGGYKVVSALPPFLIYDPWLTPLPDLPRIAPEPSHPGHHACLLWQMRN